MMTEAQLNTKLRTKRIDFSRIPTLQALFEQSPSPVICDRSVGNVFMWQAQLDTAFAECGGFGVLAETYGDRTYYAPAGRREDLVPAVNALLDACGAPLFLCSLDEDELEPLRAAFGDRIELTAQENAADYIYDADALRVYRGKKYHTQKNHVNAFLHDHPDYRFEPFTPDRAEALAAFFEEFEAGDEDGSESAVEETLACRRLLPLLPSLPLDTRLLTAGGEIVGFTVMEKVGETLMIHIEKGLTRVRGVYPMLVTLEANAYPDVRYINREEDDGNEGLRRSKQSYRPIRLFQKYYAVIR